MKKITRIDSYRPPHAPRFCIGPYEQRPFTRNYVVQRLRELAIEAGLGYAAWNGHSFRRGAATWAAEMGIIDDQIQILGHWRSDAYKINIGYSREQRIALSHRFQQARSTI